MFEPATISGYHLLLSPSIGLSRLSTVDGRSIDFDPPSTKSQPHPLASTKFDLDIIRSMPNDVRTDVKLILSNLSFIIGSNLVDYPRSTFDRSTSTALHSFPTRRSSDLLFSTRI